VTVIVGTLERETFVVAVSVMYTIALYGAVSAACTALPLFALARTPWALIVATGAGAATVAAIVAVPEPAEKFIVAA
jgi:hypothetical protein